MHRNKWIAGFAMVAFAVPMAPSLAQSIGAGGGTSPASPMGSPARPTGALALWRLDPQVAEPGVAWLERKSVVKRPGQAEFWVLGVVPDDQPTNGKMVAARWTHFVADCTKYTAAMIATVSVDSKGTIVAAQQLPPQARNMHREPSPGSGPRLAIVRACTDDIRIPVLTPTAPSAQLAIQWSRNAAAWQAAQKPAPASAPTAPTAAERRECGHAYDVLAGILGQMELLPGVYDVDRAKLPTIATVKKSMRERADSLLRSLDGIIRVAEVGERMKPWSRVEGSALKEKALQTMNDQSLACDRRLGFIPLRLP